MLVNCPECGAYREIGPDVIWYKCEECGEGVSLEKSKVHYDSPMVVIDYGCDEEGKWVRVLAENGDEYTYWKYGD